MCEPNDFYLRVFTFWFDRESIIPGNFGFAISACRLRERGHHTPSTAFWHLPPNSARFGYATEGALFISMQLSTNAVSALQKFWVLICL